MMPRCNLLFALLFSLTVNASNIKTVEFQLEIVNDEKISFKILNATSLPVSINSRMSFHNPMNTEFIGTRLVLVDTKKECFVSFSGSLNRRAPKNKDLHVFSLNPGDAHERVFDISSVARLFRLGNGNYKIKVFYNKAIKTNQGEISGPFESSWLLFSVKNSPYSGKLSEGRKRFINNQDVTYKNTLVQGYKICTE